MTKTRINPFTQNLTATSIETDVSGIKATHGACDALRSSKLFSDGDLSPHAESVEQFSVLAFLLVAVEKYALRFKSRCGTLTNRQDLGWENILKHFFVENTT